jgi:signal transduction histidine kinase
MRLAGQLLLVGSFTLLLPWAGCQYAREVESALRSGEAEAVAATARLLGAALAPATRDIAPDPQRWAPRRGDDLDLYAHRLASTPVLDGFVEDWSPAGRLVEGVGGLELAVGRHGPFTYVFAVTPGAQPPARLLLHGRDGALEFPLDAPGSVLPRALAGPADPRSRGAWQATSDGWQLEARVPTTLLRGRLGVRVVGHDGAVRGQTFAAQPGWLTGPDAAAQAALDSLAPPGLRVYLADRAGFILAQHAVLRPGGSAGNAGWMERLFRLALGTELEVDRPPAARPGQLAGRHIELAALGAVDARSYARDGQRLLAAAAPVGGGAQPALLVAVERDTAEILALTREPTRRLFAASLLASFGAALLLVGYAAWLSWRIRHLRDAAGRAVGRRGEVVAALPGTAAADELGDLARQLDELLGKVRDHNLYLQALGGRLAHELRTPLAVVRTSLDNLEAEPGASGPWLGRAREGVDRMSLLVNALAAARQMERAVAAAETERFDLAALLEGMTGAYRELHTTHAFELARPAGACPVDGAPELVAQALDKLVDNAVDFAPAESTVRLALERREQAWRLSVSNTGSRLPPGAPAQLFQSLVSRREDDRGPHLGLGLYIVRLVAERHGGRAGALNLPQDAGACFYMDFPAPAPGGTG